MIIALATVALVHVYGNLLRLGVGGYAVELTSAEAAEADQLTEDDGVVRSFGRSWEASTGPIGTTGLGSLDEQVDSLALQRHGMPVADRAMLGKQSVIAVLDTGGRPPQRGRLMIDRARRAFRLAVRALSLFAAGNTAAFRRSDT